MGGLCGIDRTVFALAPKKMQNPFFSIIIPVFNAGKYLRECLDSVLNQSFKDFECICVNDGSTDDSVQILNEYKQKDNRFRIIHQRNAGVSRARNTGLEAARGKYVCLFDSDDIILENWLKAKAEVANKYPGVDWIRTRYRDWNGKCDVKDATPWPHGHIFLEDTGVWKGNELQKVGFRKIAILGTPWLNTFKRDKLGKTRFREGVYICEDCLFMFEILRNMQSLVVIEDDSYRYRLHQGSVSHRLIDTQGFVSIFRNLNDILSGSGLDAYWSTYWINKITRRYLSKLDNPSWKNGILLRHEFTILFKQKSLVLKYLPTRIERFRWRVFLFTGLFQAFSIPEPKGLLLRLQSKIKRCFH